MNIDRLGRDPVQLVGADRALDLVVQVFGGVIRQRSEASLRLLDIYIPLSVLINADHHGRREGGKQDEQQEARAQVLQAAGRLPDLAVASVGGGSNSIGLFHAFLKDRRVKMVGVEAGGLGVAGGKHAARFATGKPGVLHGTMTYLLQDEDGQINVTHSVSAGLDYAAVGPEHSWLHDSGRAGYTSVTDDEALAAFDLLARDEGIVPALESAHAVAEVVKVAPTLKKRQVMIVNLSGRGDKDVQQVARLRGVTL